MRAFFPLLLLLGCRTPAISTGVMHRFSDDALAIASRAAPHADWALEIDPVRSETTLDALPHTEVAVLRGRVADDGALYENLEIEVLGTIAREGMWITSVHRSVGEEGRTQSWIYRWRNGEGVVTIAGSRREGGLFLLVFSVHETEVRS